MFSPSGVGLGLLGVGVGVHCILGARGGGVIDCGGDIREEFRVWVLVQSLRNGGGEGNIHTLLYSGICVLLMCV